MAAVVLPLSPIPIRSILITMTSVPSTKGEYYLGGGGEGRKKQLEKCLARFIIHYNYNFSRDQKKKISPDEVSLLC